MKLEQAKHESQGQQVAAGTPRSTRRRWAFRLAAIAVGLLPLVALEGVCWVMDWGRAETHDDPFVGFRAVQPLFVSTDDGHAREIPKARLPWFAHDSFAVPKPEGEYRAFVLGGSTVQGHPFSRQTAFSTWLEISLAAADPSRTWQFVNCGGVSYASYRLVPILEEVLRYEPDLIILYTGHNEFLEARSFEHVQRGPLVGGMLAAASHLRTFTLLREGYLRLRGRSSAEPPAGRPILPEEVEALLDYRGGLEVYERDDAWRRGVIEQFEFNLRRMVQMCRAAGVEVLLVNPVSKWSDCPPFKSQHDERLTAEQRAEWDTLMATAQRKLRREHYDPYGARALFQQACQLDRLHAGGFYNLALCHDLLEQPHEAQAAYLQAKELDVCPLRILQPMNDAVLSIAGEFGVPLVDAQQLFAGRSADGIVGGEWLVDHVHPTIEGHQLLGDQISDVLAERGVVQPSSDWPTVRRERYQSHFDSLSGYYFEQGMKRLKGLTDWAAGRARQLPGSAAVSPNSSQNKNSFPRSSADEPLGDDPL